MLQRKQTLAGCSTGQRRQTQEHGFPTGPLALSPRVF
jgi:hypothetical protein